MKNRIEEAKQKLDPIIDNCQIANENYFTYLKKYYKEIVIADEKITRKDEKTDKLIQIGIKRLRREDISKEQKQLSETVDPENLPYVILGKKILNKNITEEAKQLKELKNRKLQLIPQDLDTINKLIKRILTKRGWS